MDLEIITVIDLSDVGLVPVPPHLVMWSWQVTWRKLGPTDSSAKCKGQLLAGFWDSHMVKTEVLCKE